MTSWIPHIAALALAVSASSAFAHGKVTCPEHPPAEWRPHTELEQKLVKEGWTVRRMEKTETCYEVYGKDAASLEAARSLVESSLSIGPAKAPHRPLIVKEITAL